MGSEEVSVRKEKLDPIANVQVSEFIVEETKLSCMEEYELNLQVAVNGLNIKTFLVKSLSQKFKEFENVKN